MLLIILAQLTLSKPSCHLPDQNILYVFRKALRSLFVWLKYLMKVESEKDFPELRNQFDVWQRMFPMFRHDVDKIEDIIETHIQNYSIALVFYRQTKKEKFLEDAQKEIDEINRVIATIEKIQLMALLSQ